MSPVSLYIRYLNRLIAVIFFTGLLSLLLACNGCFKGPYSFRLSLKLGLYAGVSSSCATGLLLIKICEIIWPLLKSPSENEDF